MKSAIIGLLLALSISAIAGDEKGSIAAKEPKPSSVDWCEWLADKPGLLYNDRKNPWIDKFRISGRFHYQAGHVSGNDVRGNSFSNSFDEYRRTRIEAEIGFLKYLDLEVSVNLVKDRRFHAEPPNELQWGDATFDSAELGFDIGEAFGCGPLDAAKLHYGRMKLRVSEEVHTSSNRIKTIERSALADKLGGEQTRPTGATLELKKGPWEATFGVFSGEDDSELIGGWNDGEFLYESIAWQVRDDFRLLLDLVQNNQSGTDDALGYAQASSLAAVYEKKNWGVMANLIAGDNGGTGNGKLITARQGNFYGAIIMPWYWILENRLEVVARYQYACSDEAEGVRLDSRYIGALHSPPDTDLDNGYGDEDQSYYLGLNYYVCGDNAKIMGGISYDKMRAPTGIVEGVTYLVAFRTSF